jgi:hypothetical protein
MNNEQLHFSDLLSAIENNNRWTAPYGVIAGEGKSKKGKKYRSITFGVARYLDASILYFAPTYIVVQAQGGLAYKYEGLYKSIESLIEALNS